jgi:hypothetical protein
MVVVVVMIVIVAGHGSNISKGPVFVPSSAP